MVIVRGRGVWSLLICSVIILNGCSSMNDSQEQANSAAVLSEEAVKKQDDLTVLSDEFEDASTLGQWLTAKDQSRGVLQDQILIHRLDINETSKGHMYFEPAEGTWYGTNTGHLSYKMIDGDFIATMRVKVVGKTDSVPKGAFDLAGLMARKPSTVDGERVPMGEENWEYISTGGESGKRIVDYKRNVNREFSYLTAQVNTEWMELRLVRVGSTIIKLYKEDGQDQWKLASVHDREDLPAALQVGVCILTNLHGDPDHLVTIDYLRYERPELSKGAVKKMKSDSMTEKDWLEEFNI